jgi:ABC-type branched-subunit amino acid transport system substrate-binding protein
MNTTNKKNISRVIVLAIALSAIVIAASAQSPATAQLTPQEKRGKQIYIRGVSPSGKEITAFLGDAGVEVTASTMPCAGCHGLDGQGKPEGGVVPSNITWEALTKPYGVTHVTGRKHPPYTEKAFEFAITKGLDSGGNRLAVAMPRYEMAAEDLNDLVAYLKKVGKDTDPGLDQTTIRIGTVIPADGNLVEAGQAVKSALAAYFEETNSQGGLFNRKLELKVIETPSEPAGRKAATERFIHDQHIFAMAGAFIAGADKEMTSLVANEEVPLVGPFSLTPRVGFPVNRQVFYLFSGIAEQSRAMVVAAEQRPTANRNVAVVYTESENNLEAAEAIRDECTKSNLKMVAKSGFAAGRFNASKIVLEISKSKAGAIFFLGTGADALEFMKEAERLSWMPDVFMPGSLAGREILDAPAKFKGKLFLSFPTLPGDHTEAGVAEYRALAEKYKLSQKHLAAQFTALCAARILVEGLKLAGRDLSREKLISALEGLYELETGLMPRITFGANRRVGAMGAYLVAVDPEKKEFIPASGWITPR